MKSIVPMRSYGHVFAVAVAAAVIYGAVFFVVGLSSSERSSLLRLIRKRV
jgi:ABC-type proline/glycine betaine transport system ATPase subunit